MKFSGSQSIADVLEMSIGEAAELFENIPKIRSFLETLCAIGLGYLTLGQPAPTLSGGEAQRVKLAAELARPNTGRTLYVLDEPTTGLHFDDIAKLLKVLNSLVELGNTVVVIEHNLDVIKTADWIIDLGPEAGSGGGYIVVEGTPEDVCALASSTHRESIHRFADKEPASGGREPTESVMNERRQNSAGLHPPLALGSVSHTARVLADVLATGQRADREVFNAKATRRQRSGDVDIKAVGKSAKMPWETDGRLWHIVDRVGHNGSPCRWEGEALAFVMDHFETDDRFAPANWNHRSIIELQSTNKQGGWFLHALTGEEWLLKLKFRVKKKTFDQAELQAALDLRPLDDIEELPVYGSRGRVRVKNLRGPWQEVTLSVHWLREIDTLEFRRFLKTACEAYFDQAEVEKIHPEDITPWKVLGQRWHIMRKGFLKGKVRWNVEVLEHLFELLAEVAPDARPEWGNKVLVNYRRDGEIWAKVHTKRPAAVELYLPVPVGTVPLGRVLKIGVSPEIAAGRSGQEIVILRFRTVSQVQSQALEQLLRDRLQ